MFATVSSVGKSSVASSKWIVGPIHTRVIGPNGFINASPDTSAIRCAPRIISCRVLSLTGIGTMKILFSRAHCMTRPRRRLLSTSGTTPASYACAMLLRVSAAQSVIVLRSPQQARPVSPTPVARSHGEACFGFTLRHATAPAPLLVTATVNSRLSVFRAPWPSAPGPSRSLCDRANPSPSASAPASTRADRSCRSHHECRSS